MRTSKAIAVALALALMVGMAGCSKKKADEGASSASSSSSTTTTAAGGDGSSGGRSTTTAGSSSSGSNSSGGSGDMSMFGDCFQASMAFAALALEPLGFMGGATQEELDKMRADTENLRKEIPEEIRGDFDTYAKAMDDYANALKGLDLSGSGLLDPANQQKLQDAAKILDDPAVKKAQENIQAYFDQKCPQGSSGN